jgi:DNA-binding NarL/FixJ family response regulator
MHLVFVSRHSLSREGVESTIRKSDLLFERVVLFRLLHRAEEYLKRTERAGLLLDDAHERLMEMEGIIMRLTEQYPQVQVVLLSNRSSVDYVWQMVKAGVKGFVHRGDVDEYLVPCLEMAMFRVLLMLSPRVEGALREVDISLNNRHLLPNDLKVLRMMSEGASDKEMAAMLGRDVRTVGRCKQRLIAFLGVDSPNLIVDAARRKGLI